MSEYSMSFHLLTDKQEDAVELMRRAGYAGYVFPQNNGWVTFVINCDFGVFPEALQQANTGTLLKYVHAGDHGWQFVVFSGNSAAAAYLCRLDEEKFMLTFDPENPNDCDPIEYLCEHELNKDILSKAFENDKYSRIIEKRIAEPQPNNMTHSESAERFAAEMGLTHYAWISYEYVVSHRPEDVPLIAVE